MDKNLFRVIVRNRFTRRIIEGSMIVDIEQLYFIQDEYFFKPWVRVEAVKLVKERVK